MGQRPPEAKYHTRRTEYVHFLKTKYRDLPRWEAQGACTNDIEPYHYQGRMRAPLPLGFTEILRRAPQWDLEMGSVRLQKQLTTIVILTRASPTIRWAASRRWEEGERANHLLVPTASIAIQQATI